MVTFTASILLLLFSCQHIWVWGILRRWPPTAENVRNTDIIYGLIERDLKEAAYITVKTENKVRFLTRTAHVIGKCSCKKHTSIYQTLVCKMEGNTAHVPLGSRKVIFKLYVLINYY
jgi:hypothetical protein